MSVLPRRPTYILGVDQAARSGFALLRRYGVDIDVVDSGVVVDSDERATVVNWCFRQACEKVEQPRPLIIAMERHTFGTKSTLGGLHAQRGRWLQCIEHASIAYKHEFRVKYYMPQFWRAHVLDLPYRTEEDEAKLKARQHSALILSKHVDEVCADHAEGLCIALCAAKIEKDPKMTGKT